jgi:hypothetical protein
LCLGVEGSALVSGGGLRQSVDGRVPARRRDASCHDFFCSRPPGLGYKGQSPGRVSRLRARSGGAAARCEGGREKKKVLLIKQALQARRPNPRAFTTTLYPDSLSRCEDVWRARRDFCGRGGRLGVSRGVREKKKVLLIKQALQALRARILAPPPQVRCAGDDDVSFLHRGGLWPARCQGMRSTRLGGGVEGEQSF